MSPKIFAKSLDLTFSTNDGPVHALKDVNLDINEGDFVSFIGPSGCGKTTFLRVLADLENQLAAKFRLMGFLRRMQERAEHTVTFFRLLVCIHGEQ